MTLRHILRPTTSRIKSRLLARRWQDDAVEVVKIADGTRWQTRPAIALPDAFDRVTKFRTASADNVERLFDREFPQGPAMAYKIPDAVIFDGSIFARNSSLYVTAGRKTPLFTGKSDVIDSGLWSSYPITEMYFGHWLMDVPCHEMLAPDFGVPALKLASDRYPHAPAYRTLMGLHARAVQSAHVRALWLVDDFEVNEHRAGRMRQVGARLRDSVVSAKAERVFLRRGASGLGRQLVNENEVTEVLEGRGFTILSPEDSSVETIIATLSDARIVVGCEGSAMAHPALICRSGATLVTLQSPTEFNSLWKLFCDALGHRFAYAVGDPAEGASFTMPVDRLLKTIDLVEAAPTA